MSDADLSIQSANLSEARVRDFIALLKPRVMTLVVFTGFAGMWVAPGFSGMHPVLAAVALLCLAVGAGAAGAMNMWYDRDIDALMNRTRTRPIPTGRINPSDGLAFAMVLSLASVGLMELAINWVAAAVLAFASFFYAVIYTVWLKRRTPQNIVIGGAAGAFPPVIGWAAVTGQITLEPLILFAIIFFWTPPHFWALSLFANSDYKRAGIPMLPVVAGEKTTKIQMLVYTLILVPVSLAPWMLGFAGGTYGIAALALGLLFIFAAVKVLLESNLRYARLMFGYSVFYLFALFLALMIDAA